MTEKIECWKQALTRIEKQEKSILEIDTCIEEFFGISAYRLSKNKTRKALLVKAVFYKTCLENNLIPRMIMNYTGLTDTYKTKEIRLKFTRSFKTNIENYNAWKSFKLFYEERKYQQIEQVRA